MKKAFYSALAVTCAITGVMISKANVSNYRVIFKYKYIGSSPIAATLVTNLANWTAVNGSAPVCTGTQAACFFTSTIPTVTVAGKHRPSAAISATIGATVLGLSYYVPIKKTGAGYTYLNAYNDNIF